MAIAAAVCAAPASAATTACDYDSALKFLNVTITGPAPGGGGFAQITHSNGGEDILVRVQGPVVTCTGPQATLSNTDNIAVTDTTDDPATAQANDGSSTITINDAPSFKPGATPEANDDEIEFVVNFNDGPSDLLQVSGSAGPDLFQMGNSGVNWAVGPGGLEESEMISSVADNINLDLDNGANDATAQGGTGVGSAINASNVAMSGGNDADHLTGGNAPTGEFIRGGAGPDTIDGVAGADLLQPSFGDDSVVGGAGADMVDFGDPIATGVTFDLSKTTAQATGQGTDTVSQVEDINGTNGTDVLVGNAGPNTIQGGSGNDTIDGGLDADTLLGSGPNDTVTYATAPAGVTVDLSAGTASGGAGADTLNQFANVIGSPFADSLIGNAQANTITGLAGADEVSALAGTDTVQVRDGGPDIASCGTEVDSAVADQQSVDSISPDCETIDFLPENGGGGGGDTTLDFALNAKKKQKVAKRGRAVVSALCALEDCSVEATASARLPRSAGRTTRANINLKPTAADLAGGQRSKLRFPVRKRKVALLEQALDGPKAPMLTVKATATDAAGNRATDRQKIKITG
jgi:Ca2+-binding RTX toxin-like protein